MRALVVAHSLSPVDGSEHAAGWGLARAISTFASCDLITRSDDDFSAWESPDFRIHRLADPWWIGPAKWARPTGFLVYLLWLHRARSMARHLMDQTSFDIGFHATYSTYWLPSPVTDLGLPTVWGPVGGAVGIPPALVELLSRMDRLRELGGRLAVHLMSMLPMTRRTWRRADVILVQNEETWARLNEAARARARILNHALFFELPEEFREEMSEASIPLTSGSPLVWIAPIEPRKGLELALRALALTPPEVRLLVIGGGPLVARSAALSRELGIADRATFTGQIPRPRVIEALRSASAAVFTGLHEEGGISLAEALSVGTPVIALDHGGPRAIAGQIEAPGQVDLVAVHEVGQVIADLADAMTKRFRSGRSSPTDSLIDRSRFVAELGETARELSSAGTPQEGRRR